MQTLRIFISSPGDVAEERERARQVVQGLRRRYARHFELLPVLWEDMPLGLETGFQEGIDLLLSRDRGVDIAVFILWSRLGSALGGYFQRPDGRTYRSGTERELDMMLQARDAQAGLRPHILAYMRQDEATFDESLRGKTPAEKEEALRQRKLVASFIEEEFHDAETGTNIRAYHTYQRPQFFSERLRIHLQEILDGLTGDQIGRPAWEIDERGPPFLGLESFKFEHAEVFFGREDEVSEARLRLAAAAKRGTAFLLVGGGSGTGKSSLAAAGILPEIVAHETDDSVSKWLHATFTPAALGGDPALGIARILVHAVPSLNDRGDAADFVEGLRRDPAVAVKLALLPALKAEGKKGATARLVLLVDQLEEVFTDARLTPESRNQFAAILEALASSGAVWIVATLRGDFYPRLLGCEALVRLRSEGAQLDLVPPCADALRRMIESPALLSGLTYEKSGETTLADRILRDVSGQAELLPLLEDLLRELFEKRSPEGVLTVAAYESLGGIEGSLAKRAEASLASLPSDVQLAFPEVLRKLVAAGEGPEGTAVRRRAPLDSFSPGSPARTLVDKLVADRLATAAAGDDGTPEVTIAHEAILRVWPRVAAWIQENGEFLRLRDRLTARTREKAPLTAADPLLPAARAILETRRDAFEPDVAAYVERQVTAIDTERRRRERTRRMVFTGLSGLTVAAMITAGAAMWQWREADAAKKIADEQRSVATLERDTADRERTAAEQARSAEAEQRASADAAKLTAEGESTRAKRQLYVANLYKLQTALDRPGLTLANKFFQDASAAYRDAYGGEARVPIELAALRPSLDEAIGVLKGHESNVNSVAFSPDGTRLATCGHKTARLWDASTGKELAVLKGHEAHLESVAFSPDGTRLATGSMNNTARLWDAATGKELAVLTGHENGVTSLRFSPDGTRLATGSYDNTVRLWGLSNAEIHANRVAAEAAQKRLKAVVDEWFASDGDDAVVTQKLAAAKATLPAADWREAANLVLIESPIRRERAKVNRLAAARDRFAPLVDAWFAGITTPNFESVIAHLRAKRSELSAEDFSVLDGLFQERAAATAQKFWQSVLSNTPEGIAFFTDAVEAANDNAGMLNELAWEIEVEVSKGASVSPELLTAAVAAARRGVDLETNNGSILDTLAHLLARQGHLDEAIATQRRAVERATVQQRPVVAPFLAELEAKAAAAKSPSAEKAVEPATEAAAPAAEEPAPDGGPIAPPTDAATESPIEPAPSATPAP